MLITARSTADGTEPASLLPDAASPEWVLATLTRMEVQLKGLEAFLERILSTVTAKVTVKDWYSTTELAHLLNRRPYTVREWCRLGRVNATRTHAGRGEVEEWRISHQELLRVQNEGLLPLKHR